jgi:hypothetical protein
MKKWLKSIGVTALKERVKVIHNTSVICSVHFESGCLKTVNRRRRILPDAVPTIFDANAVNNKSTKWMVTKEGDEEVIKQQVITMGIKTLFFINKVQKFFET